MTQMEHMYQDVLEFGSGPTLEQMPRNTLQDKLLCGPTAAHRIEEVHTPVNLAYLTCTTGSSAFQNLVGVTWQELPRRVETGKRALSRAGILLGSKVLVSYPPLVSVFSRHVFDELALSVSFIPRPSRDALLAALGSQRPDAVIGESSFLRAALVDAQRLNILNELPENLTFLAAGSPLDPQLSEEVAKLSGASVHDLYGCQEFGWLCLDGKPLRDDILLWDDGQPDHRKHLLVGGLPTGDRILTRLCCDGTERVLTQTRVRAQVEPEVWIMASTVQDRSTALRAARTILRIKGKIVRVHPDCVFRAEQTLLHVSIPGSPARLELEGPNQTGMFDDLMEAQKAYQREAKTDPVWNKPC